MKTLKCGCGKDILLDDEHFDKLKSFIWNCHGQNVVRCDQRDSGLKDLRGIANFIIPVPDGFTPDHIDLDIHNNLVSNLRIANHSQQGANRRMPKSNTSGYKGVFLMTDRTNKPWRAMVKVNGKSILVGYFKTKEEAALAYNNAATKHFGEYARLNNL